MTGDQFKPSEGSIIRQGLDHLIGWRTLGVRHRERILPVGATITAIGELVHACASPGNSFKETVNGPNGTVLVLQVQTSISQMRSVLVSL